MGIPQKAIAIVFILWSLSILSCTADPWPEPDSMENDTPNRGNDDETSFDAPENPDTGTERGVGVEEDTDTNTDETWSTDTGIFDDSDTALDSEAATDTASDETIDHDAGDIVDDGGVPQFDKVFVSTPTSSGRVTLIGLAGAVSLDSRVGIETDTTRFEIPVGREGGFAKRFPADAGALLTLTVEDRTGAFYSTPIITGDLNEQFPSGIVAGGGQIRLSDSLITIEGSGRHLDGGYFAAAGNVTAGTSGMTAVVCDAAACRFSLTISAAPGEEIDLFLLRNTDNLDAYTARAGTEAETLIAE